MSQDLIKYDENYITRILNYHFYYYILKLFQTVIDGECTNCEKS